MRIIIFLLLIFLIIEPALSQVPAKKDMEKQMLSAIDNLNKHITDLEKQIAEAKKNNEDPESVKQMEDRLAILKKQVAMMGGLNKSISGISEKTFTAATEEQAIVPKKDVVRINMLPKKILTEPELSFFIKKVHAGVEKLISPAEKQAALLEYNEEKAEYKSVAITANAASGFWMIGHWEKALFIMGKICMDDISDADNLNNYAAFLIMAGGEQAALPILDYLNSKYPENSTIQNNIGQAWFGLGDIEKAKKILEQTIGLYPSHSLANSTLSKIYLSRGDTVQSIAFLKTSLKETYVTEKEEELKKMGYKIKFGDMPDFKYPMQKDPFGIIPIVQTIPEDYPSRIGDDENTNAVNRFVNGLRDLLGFLHGEDEVLKKKNTDRGLKLSTNSTYRDEFLNPHNNAAYKLAKRSVELIVEEKQSGSPAINDVKTGSEVIEECMEIWENTVVKPIADLAYAMEHSNRGKTCDEVDAAINAYQAKIAEIKKKGTKLIKQKVIDNSEQIDKWVKLNLYSTHDDPPKDNDQRTMDLISNMDFTIGRKAYKNSEIYNFLSLANNIVKKQSYLKSTCDNSAHIPNADNSDNLAPLILDNLKCEFKKVFTTPVVVYSFECNILKEKTKHNLKSKKDPVQKGQGQNSTQRNQTGNRSPLSSRPNGPSLFAYESDEQELINQRAGPLKAEDKDPSQFSIEYDQSGNLVGFNFQLNEDGTNLKDPDSIESGIDSRWSWNAIASPKKGYMNRLPLNLSGGGDENPVESRH